MNTIPIEAVQRRAKHRMKDASRNWDEIGKDSHYAASRRQ